MAPQAGQVRPARYLTIFVLIVAVLYALVFFTGGGSPKPKLGIDLQGGTRVTLTATTPDGSAPTQENLNLARTIIETRVNGIGVSGSEVLVDGRNIVITVPGADGSQARTLGQTAKLNFRGVLQVVGATPAKPAAGAKPSATPAAPTKNAAGETNDQKSAEAIKAAKATRQSTDPKVLQAALTALDCAKKDPLLGNDDPKLPLVTCDQDGTAKYILDKSLLSGAAVSNATSGVSQGGVGYDVLLTLSPDGLKTWAAYTTAHVGKQSAFVLDSQVVSAPTIQNPITTNPTQITGKFGQTEAKALAETLKYGSLPLSFTQSEAATVSASLGSASLEAGLLAGAIGLLLVFVYCLAYYRLLGILTILSLALSGLIVYAVIVLLGRFIGFTLDLSGIAGLIVAIGITADSFVVFFERLKDEVREGRSFRSAVPRGWVRARHTILSADAVSFLAAAVLYLLAVGEVKGFAFTLGVSTVLDLVVVFLVTHPLVALASRSRTLSKPAFTGLGAVQHIASARRDAARAALPKEA
ncbi:MAG: protein translocase subunit SecD [Mycobacteriaceae bacterium]